MSGSEREHLSNFLQFGEILRHSTACISAPWLHIGRDSSRTKIWRNTINSKKLQHRTELRNYVQPKYQEIVFVRKGNLYHNWLHLHIAAGVRKACSPQVPSLVWSRAHHLVPMWLIRRASLPPTCDHYLSLRALSSQREASNSPTHVNFWLKSQTKATLRCQTHTWLMHCKL